MSNAILIVGFGPAISSAVAEKFAAAGFAVGLVARSEDRLSAGVGALRAKGVQAEGFVADAGAPESIRAAVLKARAALGPISVLHWNAASGSAAGDLLSTTSADLASVFGPTVVGLVAAVQEALPDLSAARGALLVTNGALGDVNPAMDALALNFGAMGAALGNTAKHKLVGLLAQQLKPRGIYVGEVTVAGLVKGSSSDRGNAHLEASTIADKFWELYERREDMRARVP